MGKYIVKAGQNLYDIALHIYGSIEGVVDLMMNNTGLSFNDDLRIGDHLIYTDDYMINPDIVAYFRRHGIVPANGNRGVYFKEPVFQLAAEIKVSNQAPTISFFISGQGQLQIDWGDNSSLDDIYLNNKLQSIFHSFDNTVSEKRRIRIYGNEITIAQLELLSQPVLSIILYKPLYIEKFSLTDVKTDIPFISLFDGIYQITLSGIKTDSLMPLIDCKNLFILDLSKADVNQSVLDAYLIGLVKKHYGRRNCQIILPMKPSGSFEEPNRDENSAYIVNTGMEAIWLLVNEPSWNESGYWKFTIDESIYTHE